MSAEGSNPQKSDEPSSERGGGRTIFEREYDGRLVGEEGQPVGEDADVTLDVSSLEVEELNLDVENLRARVSLQAELADMVKLNVGVEAEVDKVKLEVKGLDAQALLKANLDNVREILVQALDTLDNNPSILEDLVRTADESSADSGRALEGAAGPIGDVSEPQTDEDDEDQEAERVAAGEPDATDAARRKAEELGIDLSRVEGTGSGGRILVRDVKKAAG